MHRKNEKENNENTCNLFQTSVGAIVSVSRNYKLAFVFERVLLNSHDVFLHVCIDTTERYLSNQVKKNMHNVSPMMQA